MGSSDNSNRPFVGNSTVTPVNNLNDSVEINMVTTINQEKQRFYFVDWLKFVLTVDVVFHHAIYVYFSGWWPLQKTWDVDGPTTTFFVTVLKYNQ
ncbi:hypothetical protein HK099_008593, partial [Clydaea vesicula]